MKRILFGCDAGGEDPIWEEGEPVRRTWPLPVSEETRAAILHWNDRMSAVVAAPETFDPAELPAIRRRLNEEGEALAARLNREHRRVAVVRYLPETELHV